MSPMMLTHEEAQALIRAGVTQELAAIAQTGRATGAELHLCLARLAKAPFSCAVLSAHRKITAALCERVAA